MGVKRKPAFLLLSFFLLAYLLPLGDRGLVVPDETRYGEIPREMIASGDWVVPHLNGVRYFEKPVLGYWVHAGSLLLLGENNFALRLPSALSVGLSALLIWALLGYVSRRKEEDDFFAAFLATLIFLSSFEVFGVGNTAVLDSLFSFFLTATITAFYAASEERPGSGREQGMLVLAGLSCGLAFLTKGFLACAVPVMVLVPYLIWQRRYADLLRMSWLPALCAVLVIVPWSIVMHIREPDFWHFFFWNEHIRRFLADDAQHKKSFWYFFLAAPGMFLPWLCLLPAALPGIKASIVQPGNQGRLARMCLCWLLLPFLFFSFSSGKILTYILPCFPPFAILTALGLRHILNQTSRNRLFQGGLLAICLLVSLLLAACLYAQCLGFKGSRLFSQEWKGMLVIGGLVLYLGLCLWAYRSRQWKDQSILFGMAPLFLFFVIHYTIPDRALETKSPGIWLERLQHGIAEKRIIIADADSVTAVCWHLKRSDVYVLGRPGELAYGLGYKDADGRLLDMRSLAALINRNRNETVLIARVKSITRWRDQLPTPDVQLRSGPAGYVVWYYESGVPPLSGTGRVWSEDYGLVGLQINSPKGNLLHTIRP